MDENLLEYLQKLAGLDTNREGEIVLIKIALHPDYDLVAIPDFGDPAYFREGQPGRVHRVEGPGSYDGF